MKIVNTIALLLVVVGAVNWGLVGLMKVDMVARVFGKEFGTVTETSKILYILIGVAGLYALTFFPTVGRRG